MASSASFSSDSNPPPQWKYHVFLSFRGEDTRYSFTDHLYSALWRRGIIPFRDDRELEKGDVIKDELLQAIEESLFSIVILSQNYASSTWCLEELRKILESRKTSGRRILPVFYGVDPSDVRYQRGSFAEAFRRHEERFGENSNRVESWKQALSEVANLSGYHSKNRPETELIEEIITVLWRSVGPYLSDSKDGLVGIDSKLQKMYQILEIGSSNTRFVGIWGMGGIGKTTLAKLVFNQFYRHFDISCCLENVRERSTSIDGLLGLQIKLLSKISNGNLDIDNLEQGKARIKNHLFNKKVLLLLDDVDDRKQLQHLVGTLDWFGQGSRIIVTTRDLHLLKSHDAPFEWYEIEALNTDESSELFCQYAFKRNQPKEGYLELSRIVTEYSRGLPLALEVLGSHLCGRDISIWEDFIDRMRKNPPKHILDTLRISYDGLEDAEKAIFLDIACLFKGYRWHKNKVRQILESCGFNHKIGIQILTERSLLKCDHWHFWMHDLLQDMGKKIVIQKSSNDISKQSRLWSSKDIDEVLKKNKGTKFIEGIVLEDHNYEAHCDPNAFVNMRNLRILIILHGLSLSLGLKFLPYSLKVLQWNKFPIESLPHCEELNKLVELKMQGSRIKQLWNGGTHNFEDLKFIDLSYSKHLICSPNFARVPNLGSLILKGCSNIVEVHESVAQLKKLVILNLKDCINIKYLPRKLETKSLKDFILCGCSKLKKLPEFDEDMEGISTLDLRGCKNLDCLPNSIWNSKHLKDLDISGCSKLIKLPELEIMNAIKSLERFDMSETALQEVPSFISRCRNLRSLSFRGCRGPISNPWWKLWGNSGLMELMLPRLSSFPMLTEFDASYCNIKDGSIPDDLSCLSSLKKLNLSGNNFVTLPLNCVSKLRQLSVLSLNDCPKLQTLPMLPPSLYRVSAVHCGPMVPDTEIRKLSLKMFDEVDPEEFGAPIFIFGGCLTMPGNEIPAWFDKRENDSIKIDVPHCCRSSDRWGIVLCFLVEPTTFVYPKGKRPMWQCDFQFRFEDSEMRRRRWRRGATVSSFSTYGGHLVGPGLLRLNRPHLVIVTLYPGWSKRIEAARGCLDQVSLDFWFQEEILDDCICDDDKHVRWSWEHKRCSKIRCGGWRVICNHVVRQRASINDLETLPSDSNSNHSNGFNKTNGALYDKLKPASSSTTEKTSTEDSREKENRKGKAIETDRSTEATPKLPENKQLRPCSPTPDLKQQLCGTLKQWSSPSFM